VYWRRQDGAAAVEFALILPFLVVILFAIIEFGIALTRTQAYVSAAREGARYAAVNCVPEGITCTNTLIGNRILAAAPAGYQFDFAPGGVVNPALLSVTVPGTTTNSCTKNTGKLVTVTWTQAVAVSVPFLPSVTGWTLHPTGTFRCE
jgi:Flp pilus assembly protein TadG